jgi:hypothetical protein
MLFTSGCNSTQAKQPALATGFVGPYSLNLRKDLGPKAPTVATIKHAEKVEVLETRRRFLKLRTSQGVEGWTDENLILSEKQMANLNVLVESAKRFPSQGVATVYDTLNMHVDANRNSASFYQITEGTSLDVIGHRVTQNTQLHEAQPSALKLSSRLPSGKPPRESSKRKGNKSSQSFELPLAPVPPPPPNWQELSVPRSADIAASPLNAGPAKMGDDWSLVRTKEDKVGWVLTKMLVMSLPEDMTQFIRGPRIMAYLQLGQARDKDGSIRRSWLWVTQTGNLKPFEFDTVRVYVWNTQRNRYESALNERNVKGYYPVEAIDSPGDPPGDLKGFTLVEEDKNGQLYKRTYGFKGWHAKLESSASYAPPADLPNYRLPGAFEATPVPQIADAGWQGKLKDWWSRIRRK